MADPEAQETLDAEALFRSYASFVARFLFRLGVGRESVEDLVQDVFLVVHRDGGYRSGPALPTTYLASIAVRLAANHRRRLRTRVLMLSKMWDPPAGDRGSVTPLQVLEANDTQRALQQALEALPLSLRAVLVMADLEELSCPDIAQALSLPLGTVYWRLHEARERFGRAAERGQRRDGRSLKRGQAHET